MVGMLVIRNHTMSHVSGPGEIKTSPVQDTCGQSSAYQVNLIDADNGPNIMNTKMTSMFCKIFPVKTS